MPADHRELILVAVTLDPFRPQDVSFEVPLWEWSLPDDGSLDVQDLMRDTAFIWQGKLQRLRLDPAERLSRSGTSRRMREDDVDAKINQADVGGDPLWYKDAIIYQLHVKSFFDGNNDGVGDFAGLISKLDYIAELGVTAIWLLPFYPSPLLDDGYDISEYRKVNRDYGTLG